MTGERQLKKVSEYLFLWALGGTIYYEFENAPLVITAPMVVLPVNWS